MNKLKLKMLGKNSAFFSLFTAVSAGVNWLFTKHPPLADLIGDEWGLVGHSAVAGALALFLWRRVPRNVMLEALDILHGDESDEDDA